MPIIRSSRLYVCYCRIWCAVLGCWLSGVRCRAAGYTSGMRDVARRQSSYPAHPLSVLFHQFSILIFIYTFLFPEGKMAMPGNLPKQNGGQWTESYFHLVFQGLKVNSLLRGTQWLCLINSEVQLDFISVWRGLSVISGSLSLRHGASSGCGWRNGLRYGG